MGKSDSLSRSDNHRRGRRRALSPLLGKSLATFRETPARLGHRSLELELRLHFALRSGAGPEAGHYEFRRDAPSAQAGPIPNPRRRPDPLAVAGGLRHPLLLGLA